MLSEKQNLDEHLCFSRHRFPALAEPKTFRVCYRKTGPMQFVSLLDLQRTLQKVLIRAGIPVWYTQGFNPHPKIIYAAPLSVGTESVCEYFDVRLDRDISTGEMMERLNREMTEDLRVLRVYEPKTKLQDMAWSQYVLTFTGFGKAESESAVQKVRDLFAQETLMIQKKGKAGIRELDLVPLMRDLIIDFLPESDSLRVRVLLSVEQESYVNPEQIATLIREKFGWEEDESIRHPYTILREQLYFSDGVTPFE